ncbi:MAG: hypothetical protein FWD72_02455 [Eggerthellaceae bacterium]|nr:hypothetical protein [Eggerthellaceae bacterium]
MKKILIALCCFVLLASLGGCILRPNNTSNNTTSDNTSSSGEQSSDSSSSSGAQAGGTSNTSTPSDLVITESGFSVSSSGYINFGVGVQNPNSDYSVTLFTVTVTGRDADNKILFSDDQYMAFLAPGQTNFFAGTAGNGTAPAKVDFTVAVKSDYYWTKDSSAGAQYVITNTSEIVGKYGGTQYTGEIAASNDQGVGSVLLTVILRDASGKIVYGTLGYADGVKVGQTTPFDMSAYDAPDHATYEIYAASTGY